MSDIWRLQSQFDNEGLIRALAHESPDIRRRAAVALRTIGATNAVAALRQALDRENDPDTRQAMLLALETLDEEAPPQAQAAEASPPAPPPPPPSAVGMASPPEPPSLPTPKPSKPVTSKLSVDPAELGRLLAQLESTNPDEVVNAALRLGEMGDRTAAEPLVVLFTSPKTSGEIKLAVAEALLKLNSAPVEVALLASLRHTHPDVRRKGAAILGHLKAEWAIQPLGEALRDPVQIVRRTARAALKNIGTPESRKILARFDTGQLRPSASAQAQAEADASADTATILKRPPGGLLKRVETNESPVIVPPSGDGPLLPPPQPSGITRPLKPSLDAPDDDDKPPHNL